MANAMVKNQSKLSPKVTELDENTAQLDAGKKKPKNSTTGKQPVSSKGKENVVSKGKEPIASTSSETGSVSNPKQTANPSASFSSEVVGILKELHQNQTKVNERLETLSSRVDAIYNDSYSYDELAPYDENEFDYEQYPEYDDAYENRDLDQSSEAVSSVSVVSEPPSKIQKLEQDSVFKNISEKFNPKEMVDSNINDELAMFVNSAFREGISDEKQTELVKEIHRPSNCNALVKTTVNQPIWRFLKPQTQTDDVKMQGIQNNVIKAAINFTKILNICGETMGQNMVELGTNALALLGQSNKQINNKRKEFHKSDLDVKYHYLSSSILPYTDKLYGDDVNKNIKDIQDMNRLSKNIGRGSGAALRGHRGRRPFRFFGRGRARGRGYGRGISDSHQQYHTLSSATAPKNGKAGGKK